MNNNINHAEIAKNFHDNKLNCSQSVFCAFAEEFGVSVETAKLIACAFGAGMGGMRETCGTVTGAFMVLGLAFKDLPRPELYKKAVAFSQEFKKRIGFDSILCRDLLGITGVAKEIGYKKLPCRELVGISAEILEEFLNDDA